MAAATTTAETFLPRSDPGTPNTDRGWAWVVLVACFVSTTIIYGLYLSSAGIYFVAFLRAFGHSRSATSWVFTALFVAAHAQGPLGGLLMSKLGARATMMSGAFLVASGLAISFMAESILFLAIAFTFCGVGTGFVMSSNLAATALYFDKRLGVATGLTNSGAGLGILLVGSEIEWSIETFGWRGSLLVQSGIVLQILVCGALVFPVEHRRRQPQQQQQRRIGGESPTASLVDGRMIAMLASCVLYFGALCTVVTVMKDAFVNHGFDGHFDTVLAYFGVAGAVGRLSAGFASHYFPPPTVHYLAASILDAMACVALAFNRSQWLFVAAAASSGGLAGYQAVSQALTMVYLFGRRRMAIVWSYGLFVSLAGVLGTIPLAGWMIDATGSYVGPFLMSGVLMFVSGLLVIFSHWLHQKRPSTTGDSGEK